MRDENKAVVACIGLVMLCVLWASFFRSAPKLPNDFEWEHDVSKATNVGRAPGPEVEA
eukprot:CAMPEP_0174364232 /NCGR_PEP_ID=MMETSP0811_2-20130205/72027_1 /TAXON_ID=73025 ORGANISM="Eutreptiella gymnastica-like, Strain CCMP1594" /NCGR_SAMPLE_ID=MMETSP0811_2 /ASSEMBLY_ACC=CAM_ASM_000667 /LENGTH=57 /DNA_ID=CAMNT_0015503667 /DNA_START=45 /DNA_END=215 /DNA_ORIENTATION=+